MEKIKRANNLYTSDSLFLRPTLSIPIDKKPSDQCEENGLNDNESSSQSSELNGYHNKTSTYLNGNSSSSVNSNSSATTNSSNTKEHNNNLDYKICLNEIRPQLDDVKPSTSNQNLNQTNLNELRKDESMDDFLFRIDQYIKQSKVKMDNFATTSEIISSQSDDDLFKLHNYGYPKKSLNYRQRSLHNNDICLHEIRDKNNHENREVIYSLRKLEKEQEEREKFEL